MIIDEKKDEKRKVEFHPCPFCGKMEYLHIRIEGQDFLVEDGVFMYYQVCCGWCGMRGPSAGTKEEAMKEWKEKTRGFS